MRCHHPRCPLAVVPDGDGYGVVDADQILLNGAPFDTEAQADLFVWAAEHNPPDWANVFARHPS